MSKWRWAVGGAWLPEYSSSPPPSRPTAGHWLGQAKHPWAAACKWCLKLWVLAEKWRQTTQRFHHHGLDEHLRIKINPTGWGPESSWSWQECGTFFQVLFRPQLEVTPLCVTCRILLYKQTADFQVPPRHLPICSLPCVLPGPCPASPGVSWSIFQTPLLSRITAYSYRVLVTHPELNSPLFPLIWTFVEDPELVRINYLWPQTPDVNSLAKQRAVFLVWLELQKDSQATSASARGPHGWPALPSLRFDFHLRGAKWLFYPQNSNLFPIRLKDEGKRHKSLNLSFLSGKEKISDSVTQKPLLSSYWPILSNLVTSNIKKTCGSDCV